MNYRIGRRFSLTTIIRTMAAMRTTTIPLLHRSNLHQSYRVTLKMFVNIFWMNSKKSNNIVKNWWQRSQCLPIYIIIIIIIIILDAVLDLVSHGSGVTQIQRSKYIAACVDSVVFFFIDDVTVRANTMTVEQLACRRSAEAAQVSLLRFSLFHQF